MKTSKLNLFSVAAFCLVAGSVAHANLVVNGGFEENPRSSDGFYGWEGTGAYARVDNTLLNNAHTGDYAALFYSADYLDGIVQSYVPTTAGAKYEFDFWLMNDVGDGVNEYGSVSWNGAEIIAFYQPGDFGWTHFGFTVIATTASTPISFQFQQKEGLFRLDDVRVVEAPVLSVPEPSTYCAGALLLLPFGANLVRKLRKNRAA